MCNLALTLDPSWGLIEEIKTVKSPLWDKRNETFYVSLFRSHEKVSINKRESKENVEAFSKFDFFINLILGTV